MNYISLGSECSSAAALRSLNLRNFALPFDWVQTKYNQLYNCLYDDFSRFHTNLRLSVNKKRIIDDYGIEYPHDYPTCSSCLDNDITTFGEDVIVDHWQDYVSDVSLKYARRIERFRNVFKEVQPIIVLFRSSLYYANQIKLLLQSKYNRKDIYFVVATYETQSPYLDIVVCDPEKNGTWNDEAIWLQGIVTLTANIMQNRNLSSNYNNTNQLFILSRFRRPSSMAMIKQ
jgi:hypothetical protein